MGGGVKMAEGGLIEGELGAEGGGLQGLFCFQPSPFQSGVTSPVPGVVAPLSRRRGGSNSCGSTGPSGSL